MPRKKESTIEAEVVRKVARKGWLSRKLTGMRGDPDRLYMKATPPCPACGRTGVVVLIEHKALGKIPRRLQQYVHGLFAKAGFPVHVSDDVDQALAILKAEEQKANTS